MFLKFYARIIVRYILLYYTYLTIPTQQFNTVIGFSFSFSFSCFFFFFLPFWRQLIASVFISCAAMFVFGSLQCLSILNFCSAAVINYDLLVGDMLFYNQTLVFALREKESHGLEMLQLIEKLMAPWSNDSSDKRHEVMPIDVRIIDSMVIIYSVIGVGFVSFSLLLVTVLFMLTTVVYNVYRKITGKRRGTYCNDETIWLLRRAATTRI